MGCKSTEESLLHSSVGQCYWQGPAFHGGHGEDQLKQMVQQRVNRPDEWTGSREHPDGINTELVVDNQILTEMLKEDFDSTITAFVVFKSTMLQYNITRQDEICDHFWEQIAEFDAVDCPPTVGFDPSQSSNPFFALA